MHAGVTVLLRRFCSPSLSVSSLTAMALGRSCLFAKTSTTASLSSSSCNCTYAQEKTQMRQLNHIKQTKHFHKCPDSLHLVAIWENRNDICYHFRKLFSRFCHSLSVIAVHHKDQTLGWREKQKELWVSARTIISMCALMVFCMNTHQDLTCVFWK